MLLDKSYFIGSLTIAQLGQKAVVDSLTVFINNIEPEILQAALGYDLYTAFKEGLEVGSGEEIEQRWLDLRDGVMFTNISGYKRKWKGLANDETKDSAHAGLIWEAFIQNQVIQATGVGLVQTQPENAEVIDPTPRLCEVHNQSYRDLKTLWEYLEVNITTFTEYDTTQIDRKYFTYINQFGI